jgi:hypothetical protein
MGWARITPADPSVWWRDKVRVPEHSPAPEGYTYLYSESVVSGWADISPMQVSQDGGVGRSRSQLEPQTTIICDVYQKNLEPTPGTDA